ISPVIGWTLATPRMPSVPKSRRDVSEGFSVNRRAMAEGSAFWGPPYDGVPSITFGIYVCERTGSNLQASSCMSTGGRAHRVDDGERLPRGRHVMDAHDRSAVQSGDHGGRDRADEALRGGFPAQLSQEGLARSADHQRPAQLGQLAQAPQKEQVVLRGLREAKTGIEGDAVLADARRAGAHDRLPQFVADLREKIGIGRVRLHVGRRAAHVHEAYRRAALRD